MGKTLNKIYMIALITVIALVGAFVVGSMYVSCYTKAKAEEGIDTEIAQVKNMCITWHDNYKMHNKYKVEPNDLDTVIYRESDDTIVSFKDNKDTAIEENKFKVILKYDGDFQVFKNEKQIELMKIFK